jgi:ectoine hydroxylase-related dioxygenase (phytanoyl-CoA dioxygenase family)
MAADVVRSTITEIHDRGYAVLHNHFPAQPVDACRSAFWPRLLAYLDSDAAANRGPHRHFMPMPFDPPCLVPQFFFDPHVLAVVRGLMDDRVVADQWGCDVPLRGSEYQEPHVDYRRPLFPEAPDLVLPSYAIVVSFGLVRIAQENGPIEIAPGTHRLTRTEANLAVERGDTRLQPVPLEIGDVLIRHPWALHRGTPNTTDTPRALASIRYVRRWYADDSRDVCPIPRPLWDAMPLEQQQVMRFPIGT